MTLGSLISRFIAVTLGAWSIYFALWGPQNDGVLVSVGLFVLALGLFVRAWEGRGWERLHAVSLFVAGGLAVVQSIVVGIDKGTLVAMPWAIFALACGIEGYRLLARLSK